MSEEIADLREDGAELLLKWARTLAPYYGASGRMELDLAEFPDAEGPSYYNQFAHYAYLLLSEGVVPGATDEERVAFRKIGLQNIQSILDMTDNEFHTPHYSRGRDWGRHIGEWLNYYLLGSLSVMEKYKVGEETLRTQVSRVVQGAVGQLVDRFRARFENAPVKFPGNHATWHGLLFYRAGLFFDRADWVDFARDFFGRHIMPTQRSNGVWPEGEGIVVNYSMVTAQAVSLYAEASGDQNALVSMERALGFFKYFSLPDGSSAVAADCRMRYHARPFVFLPPSFLRCAEGRQVCRDRIQLACALLEETTPSDNGAQGLAFYASFVHFLFEHDVADGSLTEKAPENLPVARVAKGDWTGFLSWQLTPENPSRFILDTQNFLEIYHAESGYLIGAGNSKYMPRFSTVRQKNKGRAYLPDQAICTAQSENSVTCVYSFGQDEVQITLSFEQAACVIRFGALPSSTDAVYEAGIMLAFKAGEPISFGEDVISVLPTAMINHAFRNDRLSFSWRDRVFEVPAGAVLDYPLIPHNPYTQHGLPSEEAYIARLSFQLSDQEKTIVIR